MIFIDVWWVWWGRTVHWNIFFDWFWLRLFFYNVVTIIGCLLMVETVFIASWFEMSGIVICRIGVQSVIIMHRSIHRPFISPTIIGCTIICIGSKIKMSSLKSIHWNLIETLSVGVLSDVFVFHIHFTERLPINVLRKEIFGGWFHSCLSLIKILFMKMLWVDSCFVRMKCFF